MYSLFRDEPITLEGTYTFAISRQEVIKPRIVWKLLSVEIAALLSFPEKEAFYSFKYFRNKSLLNFHVKLRMNNMKDRPLLQCVSVLFVSAKNAERSNLTGNFE